MKRVISCFFVLLICVALCGVFVGATGSLYIKDQPNDIFVKTGETFQIRLTAVGDGLTYQWYWKPSKAADFSEYTSTVAYVENTAGPWWNGLAFKCVVTDSSGRSVTSRVAHVYVDQNILTVYVFDGLSAVLDWIGSVSNALLSPDGALFPLIGVLAIGIAVAALLLGIKAIRSFGWGL